MGELIRKTMISLGLYDPRTLIAKFYELLIINRKRYFNYQIDKIPDQIISEDEDNAAILACGCGQKTGGKIIYYLVHCFYPFSQGGTERFIYNMAIQARKEGNRVKIITYNAIKPRKQFKNQISGIQFNEYQIDGLDVVEYRHKRAPRGILKDIVIEDQAVVDFAQFLFKREKPDILHAAYIQKTSSFIAACRKIGVPYGITLTSFYCLCHYDIMIDQKGRLCSGSEKGEKCRRVCGCLDIRKPSLRYQRMHQILQDASFITTPSIFVKKMVAKEFADANIHVINHGISREFMSKDSNITFSKEVKNFAYFGTLSPVKGVHGLITAFNDMPAEYNLNIFGTGSDTYIKKLKKLVAGKDNIIFRGSVRYDEMSQAYMDQDIIVVPSIWYETYNFVVHEALLMNKIVIASRIGAIPERIKDGINGFTFRAGDWQDLQLTMEKAIRKGQTGVTGASEEINTIESEFEHYNWLYEQAMRLES